MGGGLLFVNFCRYLRGGCVIARDDDVTVLVTAELHEKHSRLRKLVFGVFFSQVTVVQLFVANLKYGQIRSLRVVHTEVHKKCHSYLWIRERPSPTATNVVDHL